MSFKYPKNGHFTILTDSLLYPVFRILHFHQNPQILLAERFVENNATSSQLTIDANEKTRKKENKPNESHN